MIEIIENQTSDRHSCCYCPVFYAEVPYLYLRQYVVRGAEPSLTRNSLLKLLVVCSQAFLVTEVLLLLKLVEQDGTVQLQECR